MKDKITESIDIHAPLQHVWDLVSEPGWWINKGSLGTHRIDYAPDDASCTVHDPELGPWHVGILALDPPNRAVFTWEPAGPGAPATTVEFTLVPAPSGTVTLTVTETGFAAMSPEQHRTNYGSNADGWREELGLATVALTGVTGADRA